MLGGTFFPVAQAGGAARRAQPAHAAGMVPARDREHDGRRRRPRRARAGRARSSRSRAVTGALAFARIGQAGGAMKALTIAATDLRRLLRWRANIFFLFVLPMLIILLLGAAFGGSQTGANRRPRPATGHRSRGSSSTRPGAPSVDAARRATRAPSSLQTGRRARRRRRRARDPGRLRRAAAARRERDGSTTSPARTRSLSS